MPFFCPVDAGEWEKRNRVNLFPGLLQRWVIGFAVSGEESAESMGIMARAFMNHVFSRGVPRFTGDIGAATDFKILDVSSTAPGTPEATQSRESLDPIPFLKPGPAAFVTVEFAWRGPAAEMPWPVTRLVGGRLHGVNTFCPLDANAMLMATKNLEVQAPPRKVDDQGLGAGGLGNLGKHVAGIATAITTTIAVAGLAWFVFQLEKK